MASRVLSVEDEPEIRSPLVDAIAHVRKAGRHEVETSEQEAALKNLANRQTGSL